MRQFMIACFVLAAAACGGAPAGPSSTGVTVHGRVINFADNTSVAGATVAFGDVTAITDISGSYSLTVPGTGRVEPVVDGSWMGISQLTAPTYRGDFLVRGTGCVARYGIISDATTHHPVAGAIVTLAGTATTDVDGWYRMDFGCPANGLFGFNTIGMTVSHQLYMDATQSVGRGIFGVSRLDVELSRK
jgi:hypothetical protein